MLKIVLFLLLLFSLSHQQYKIIVISSYDINSDHTELEINSFMEGLLKVRDFQPEELAFNTIYMDTAVHHSHLST